MNNTTTTPAEEKLVDIDELIEMLWSKQSAPPKASIYKFAQKGMIPSEKLGKRTFFRPSAVREAMSRKMKFRVTDNFSDPIKKKKDDLAHNNAEAQRLGYSRGMREQG